MKVVAELDRYVFGTVSAARPYLLLKMVLLLLALDAWVVMIEHGGRYGVGAFNVAHFALLDALQPVPTAGFYVGLMLFVGMLAFVSATAGSHRVVLSVLATLYTYGWAMSMLDSYQHHYLISIVLVTFIGFPVLSGRAIFGESGLAARPPPSRKRRRRKKPRRAATLDPKRVSSWAYNTLMVSVAIVYGYTAISKAEEDWRLGHALQRIAPEPMEPFRAYFVDDWGMAADTFWALVGHSVIMLQVVIMAGYLLAPLRDRGDRGIRVLCWIGFVAAVSFHVGAEYLELRIGWFSWYMIGFAAVVFLPERWVWHAGSWLSLPARAVGEMWQRSQAVGGSAVVPIALGTALVVGLAGYAVDMPGSLAAAVVAALLLAGGTAYLFLKAHGHEAMRWIVATAVAALCMWLSISSSEVRFDYYRFVGGDHRRRGEYEQALEAYVKANRYAPEDDDRKEKEEEMRRIVEAQRRSGR